MNDDRCLGSSQQMDTADVTSQGSLGATIAEVVGLLPSKPSSSSEGRGWDGITLHRYRDAPPAVEFPPTREHRLGLHLAKQTFLDSRCEGRRETRWSDGGCMNLVPAGVPLTRLFKDRPDVMHLYMEPMLVDEVAKEVFDRDSSGLSLVPRVVFCDEVAERLGRLLLAEAEAGGPGGRLLADGLARALVVHLWRHHSSRTPPAAGTPNGGAMADWRLRRVIEYLNVNLAEDLSLSQLSAISGLGPTQFGRAFRAATGDAPHQYLIKLRIERARSLLESTGLPVIEVGFRCGFKQPNHFATMFRKLTGSSPRAYRRTYRT